MLGRPLKGLRQKDIDPNEREAIMTEMFKRARPFLERNIEKAKQKEVEREEDEREDEERRKQDAIRAERLLRARRASRCTCSPPRLRISARGARRVPRARAPGHAPHGGADLRGLCLRCRRRRSAL